MISISIVIPVFSGEDYISNLMAAIDNVRKKLQNSGIPISFDEVIFVDDAAIDDSPLIIDRLAEAYPYVTPLHLSRNYGQHPATIAGILHTSGDWVVTMDEDLQHHPENIIRFLHVAEQTRVDIVYGKPIDNVHQSATRDFTSRFFKRFMERVTGDKHITKANSFRLMRGSIARATSSVCGHDSYFDVVLGWFTQRIETCAIEMKDTRFIKSGKSGYNFKSLLSHARRMAFSSQIKLLRAGALAGAALLLLTAAISFILIVLKLFVPSFAPAVGWTSTMLMLCFFGGSLLLMSGILLEYMSILVMRAHGKPLYFTVDRSSDDQLRGIDQLLTRDERSDADPSGT